jgi:hypothetical protein
MSIGAAQKGSIRNRPQIVPKAGADLPKYIYTETTTA